VRKSGLKKAEIKPHDLRRTFGTWFLQANPGHVRELAELMGHSDLSQVMKYALSDEMRARAGVARLRVRVPHRRRHGGRGAIRHISA